MKTLSMISVLCLLVAGCAGQVAPTSEPAPVATTEGAPLPVPADPVVAQAADASAPKAPCALTIESISPKAITIDPGSLAQTAEVTIRGCGFLKVQDVEVSVQSVTFTATDDTTIVATVPFAIFAGLTLPYSAEVDVIVAPSDQVQTFLTVQ